MPPGTRELLTHLLKDVSRSFYKTMRMLPRKVRPQISLAYLLARTTDTVADTQAVPLDQRLRVLRDLRERVLGTRATPVDFGTLAERLSSTAERRLLARCEESLAVLASFAPTDQKLIREVLSLITSGQELDLERFAGANAERIVALQTDAELDDYIYRVAGCVGEFWTRICRTHLFPRDEVDEQSLLEKGVRFGKGLQLVNVLRDLPTDVRQGRCYLPATRLAEAGLGPADLLRPETEPTLRPIYDRHLAMAFAHLAAGWTYTNALPHRLIRVRLACAWPILIGARTLQRLKQERVLDPGRRIKVSRAEVRAIILRSMLTCVWPGAWQRMFPNAPA